MGPLQGLNAYYLNHQKDSIEISLQNTQRLPIEVTKIIFDNKKKLPLNESVILKGKEHGKPVENYLVKFSTKGYPSCRCELLYNPVIRVMC